MNPSGADRMSARRQSSPWCWLTIIIVIIVQLQVRTVAAENIFFNGQFAGDSGDKAFESKTVPFFAVQQQANAAVQVQPHLVHQTDARIHQGQGRQNEVAVVPKTKVIPESGWLPLVNPVISDRQPAITFIQPTPGPIVVQQIVSQHESPALTSVNSATRFTVVSSTLTPNLSSSSKTHWVEPDLVDTAMLKGPALTFYPNDTFSLQYLSIHPHESRSLPDSQRTERAASAQNQQTIIVSDPDDGDHSLMGRIKRMSACSKDVSDLIVDILQSPLRERNALLGMLKMEKMMVQKTTTEPVPQPPDIAKGVVENTFNIFPGFQQRAKTQDNPAQLAASAPAPAQRSSRAQFQGSQVVAQQSVTSGNKEQGQIIQEEEAVSKNLNEFPATSQQSPPPVSVGVSAASAAESSRSSFSVPPQNDDESAAEPNRAHISIEEFLQRYPEVRRVSSRFGDEHDSGRVSGNEFSSQSGLDDKPAVGNSGQPVTFFNLVSGFTPRQTPSPVPVTTSTTPRAPITTLVPTPTPTPRPTPTPITATTRRPITAGPSPTPPPTIRPKPPTPRIPAHPSPPAVRAKSPTPRLPAHTSPPAVRAPPPASQTRSPTVRPQPVVDQERPTNQQQGGSSIQYPDYSDDSALSSDDYSYLYYEEYYEELVPEHHRFLQLEATTASSTMSSLGAGDGTKSQKKRGRKSKNRKSKANQNQNVNANINQFSFFSGQPADEVKPGHQSQTSFPNFPLAGFAVTTSAPAPSVFHLANKEAPVSVVEGSGTSSSQSGPFGYVDKGTYFVDNFINEFPESIEVIYQGFIWAFDIKYPSAGRVIHGGIHNVLKDKVKRDRMVLKDDFIVRVEGRASPFNINRLTFHTAKGRVYGPWGDRRSKESIDFDVVAPPGHALAYFSGTIDFGVPLRSVSFHWLPIPA